MSTFNGVVIHLIVGADCAAGLGGAGAGIGLGFTVSTASIFLELYIRVAA